MSCPLNHNPYGLRWGGGVIETIPSRWICCPGLFAGHKDIEGHDSYECKLLCEQRRNLLELPVRGRRIGRQCHRRGSGPIVLDRVTPVQGVQESRTQGEGV
jgi:hypothetical protein